jgi:hypothetical protein
MQLVKVIPAMNQWRTELKKQERAKRIAFEIDKAHHFALVEHQATKGVGYKKFESQKAQAIADGKKRSAEKAAQRLLIMDAKRKLTAEQFRRQSVRWAFRFGPRMMVKPDVSLPVIAVLRIAAEVLEVKA